MYGGSTKDGIVKYHGIRFDKLPFVWYNCFVVRNIEYER